ncbi:hypothetical protein [Variovorax atrisoli]|uniref:hypothetical protein n=1 Tax=Variovorax atrisoli TaxID=3394203 RepID=UPI0003782F33|nr:hypothetical protein [Variovorax paradoxus]
MTDKSALRVEFEKWLKPYWSRETFKPDEEGESQYCEEWVQGAWCMFYELKSLPTPATTMVDERGEPKAFDAFLCRAWGETDLASAELVTDWEGVRRFMIREWLGREDEETLLQIKDDFDRHEEDHNGRGGAHEITFEIGGVSIERVCGFATRPTLQSLGGDAVVLSHTQIADCVTAVRPYSTALATVPAEELIAFVRNVESALSLTSTEESDGDTPSAKQQKLYELADRIDYERLCLRPGMTHRDMTPEQRDRMNAGVELRRYARIWKADRWIIVPPVGPVQFSASTLDAAYEMAKKDEVRNATAAAPKAAEKSGRSE